MKRKLGGYVINIGRDPSSDIELTDEDVSRTHASIVRESGSYKLIDKSTNGTVVNDKKVSSHSLSVDDVITIGSWKIRFEPGGVTSRPATVIKDISPTRVLKYEKTKNELLTESLELTISTPDGKERELRFAGGSIGASPANDITINDDRYISGSHCMIKSVANGFIIQDVGSRNGTLLNDALVMSERLPKSGVITIGKTLIKYKIKESRENIRPFERPNLGNILGASLVMRELFSLAERIAPTDATVLITGESGTGKELFARYMHEGSARAAKPFMAINCGAISSNLIESELFGHERGAFTSAVSQQKGAFEQASSGTLFLDEIGEMPLELQTRLLRVLENMQIRRVGGQSDISVDVRLVAATNKNLKEMVRKGKFREDLFFRLFIVPIHLPPLRERRDDITVLALHFLNDLSPEGGSKIFDAGVLEKLREYNWPGNVRELKNTIQRAILISKDASVKAEDMIFSELTEKPPESLPLDDVEKKILVTALKNSSGNASKAARELKISRTTLYSMLGKFGIRIEPFKVKE